MTITKFLRVSLVWKLVTTSLKSTVKVIVASKALFWRSKYRCKSRRFLLLCLFPVFLIYLVPAFGQDYQLGSLGSEDGLSSDAILTLLQDKEGFIWIGTENGLNRFDGQHFVTFRFDPEDQGSLSSNFVNSLFEDSRQRLWIGTSNGLNLLIKNFGKFRRIPLLKQDGNIATTRITKIHEDEEQNIWISTENEGLFELRDDLEYDSISAVPFAYQSESDFFDQQTDLIELIERDGDNLWVSTGKGIDRLHIPSRKIDHYLIPDARSHISMPVLNHGDSWYGQGNILMSRTDSIYFFDIHDLLNGIRPIKEYFAGLSLTLPDLAKERTLCSIYRDNGLLLVNRTNIALIDLESGTADFLDNKVAEKWNPNSFSINSVLVDHIGNIWIGTYGGGITICSRNRNYISQYEHDPEDPTSISSSSVRTLTKDNNENIWIGTLKSGLDKCIYDQDGRLKRIHSYSTLSGEPNELSDAQILQLTRDLEGNLWISTSHQGLFRLDPLTLEFANFKKGFSENTISENRIWGVEVDRSNRLWVGTWSNGLNYLDPKTGSVKHFKKGSDDKHTILSNNIRTLHLESDSILWIGSREGLSRMNILEETFTHFTHSPDDPSSLSNNLVWSIYSDREKNLWIGTDIGLNKLDRQTGQFDRFYENSGLPNNCIYGFLEDREGTLWISTQNGLARKIPSQTEIAFQSFTASEGLRSSEFVPKAHFMDKETGKLYFGTVRGIVTIDPQLSQQSEISFNPGINSISIFDVSESDNQGKEYYFVNEGEIIELSHRDKIIEISLADLNLHLGNFYDYEYHLSGFGDQWRNMGPERVMTFTNLDPGQYHLYVRRNSLGQHISPEIKLISLNILPPWWKTWLAYLSYLFLTGGLLYRFYRIQVRRQLVKQEMKNLQDLDTFKNEFYTNITHEFRTPLTIISGMAGQIMENPARWGKKGAKMIRQNSGNLLNLVNQILDLRKLEAKEFQLNMVQGDVVRYLGYLCQSYEYYARSKGLQLHFFPAIEKLVMDFDPEKLLRIVSNLLSNAVKYTPDGGNVYLHLNQSAINKKSLLDLRVEDTGAGIASEDLPHIFDRFYQVDASTTRKGEGTGIGLALTQELIKLMNGSIDVKSTPGKGTTFTVLLPITNDSPVTEVLTPEVSQYELPIADTPVAQPGIKEDRPSGKQNVVDLPNLLIVEDNRDIRQFLVACLENDYELETATNGQEGIDLALEVVPDLIISDVMMPEKDGFELCETLKNDERTSHIPIILLTAKADMKSKISGLKTGADAYLTKPFEQEELLVRLQKLFELRQKLQSRYRSLEPALAPENKEDEFVLKVRQVVMENLSDESFGITQLYRALGLSRSQLHNKLKALTGQSTSLFVRSIRLHKAKELLENSGMNISEIGYEVGFKNPSYFSSAYQEEFGVTPSETRK